MFVCIFPCNVKGCVSERRRGLGKGTTGALLPCAVERGSLVFS